MTHDSRIYVAGHTGLVGSSLLRLLKESGYQNLIYSPRNETNLVHDLSAVWRLFSTHKPEYVFLCAAEVGGIKANDERPVDFLFNNLQIQNNVIWCAHESRVKKLLFLGSSCIYPKFARQPILEDYLMTGPLEPTNQWYALAKIAGLKLCQAFRKQYGHDYISCMPTNLYGPGDNYDRDSAHVIPGMFKKFHHAKVNNVPSVTLWGDGTPRREFLYVDDLARACVALMKQYSEADTINVGFGEDYQIYELAKIIADVVQYKGTIEWDTTKPTGTPRKFLDSSRILKLGWEPVVSLKDGLTRSYIHALVTGQLDAE